MNPQQLQENIVIISDSLSKLADKLQQPAGKIWELAFRQNYVTVVVDIFYCLIFGVFSVAFYKLLHWGFSTKKGNQDNNFYNNDWTTPVVICMGVSWAIAFIIIVFGGIPEIINRLVNPEWATLQDIVKMVQGVK